MLPDDDPSRAPEDLSGVECADCRDALEEPGRNEISFLLLDRLTIPVVGCEAHLERFATICSYATTDRAERLDHRPAGGVACPGCRLAVHNPERPVIPVEGGAVGVLACPEHGAELLDRFQTGFRTEQQVTGDLDSTPSVEF